MPIYEYQCQACEHRLEALQKISDDPLTDCPECHQSALKKLVSASAFRLGGSGWYETDFKSGNKKNLAGGSESGEKAASASSDKAGETKTETPAAKAKATSKASTSDAST